MTRKFLLIVGVVLSLCMNGCLFVTLDEPYSAENIVFIPELVGEWQYDIEEKEHAPVLIIEQLGENKYIFHEDSEDPDAMEITLFKIGKLMFIDYYPIEKDRSFVLNEKQSYPLHYVMGFQFKDDKIRLSTFDGERYRELLDKRKLKVQYFEDEEGLVLITDKTPKIQKVLKKYGAVLFPFEESSEEYRRLKKEDK